MFNKHKTFQSILMNIRHDDDDLMERVLTDIFNVFETKEILRVLVGTLEKRPNERFTLK